MYRVSEMGSVHPAYRFQNRDLADLYIEPDVKDFNLIGSEQSEECMRLGYEAAIKAFKKWDKLPFLQKITALK